MWSRSCVKLCEAKNSVNGAAIVLERAKYETGRTREIAGPNDSVRQFDGDKCAGQHEGARQGDASVRVSTELLGAHAQTGGY